LSHISSPFALVIVGRWGSHILFSQAGRKLWPSQFQPHNFRGLQVWATCARFLMVLIQVITIAWTYHFDITKFWCTNSIAFSTFTWCCPFKNNTLFH
jgi:hypothetical protein